jgi:hypothetical protein
MKKPIYSLLSLVTLVLILGVGVSLSAQQPGQTPQNPTQPSTQPQRPDTPQQPAANPEQPGQQPQAQPGQAPDTAGQPPDAKAQSAGNGAGQTFVGTVTKSGDKYVLQDASGTTYDIDNQDAAKKFEGKKVKIQGTLDPNGKTIHVQ